MLFRQQICMLAGPVALWSVFTLGGYRTVAAQDSHYGTHLYGDRSTLLGGGVIASVDDASAAYYNPGALADIAAKDVFLGTKVFDATRITLERTGVEDFKIDTDNVGKAPSFIGGMIPIRSKEHRFAYSFLKRASFALRLTATEVDAPVTFEGLDILSNRLGGDFDASLNEDWLGLSWAYAFSEKTRFGISNFFSYRSHRWSSLRSAEWYQRDGILTTTMLTREYRYSYLSVLWKLGVKHHFNDRLLLGMSFTTPSVGLGLLSDGSAGAGASVAGTNDGPDGQPQDIFVADFQSKLASNYRSPIAVGAGGSYRYPERTVHVSVEWFGPVETYDVLDPQPFVAQSSGDTLDHQVLGGAKAVLNLGVGLEEHFKEKVDLFFGFHTDFSSARRDVEGSIYLTQWNLYHLNAGSQFLLGVAQITLGLGYAFGSEKVNHFPSIDDISNAETSLPDATETNVRFSRFKFILGFGVRT